MRTIDAGHLAARQNAAANGFVTRDLVTIFATDRLTNDIVQFAFWNDLDTVAFNVVDGETGAIVSRNWIGNGSIVDVGDIVHSTNLAINRCAVALNHLHEQVELMFRGYEIRLCRAEVHRAILDPSTHNLVGNPYCELVGQVNVSPLTTPGAGGEGVLSLDIVSDTEEWTLTNPARMSHETQKRRQNDQQLKYASLTKGWNADWGEEKVDGK